MLALCPELVRRQTLIRRLEDSRNRQLRHAIGNWTHEDHPPLCFLGQMFKVLYDEGVSANRRYYVYTALAFGISEARLSDYILRNDNGTCFHELAQDLKEEPLHVPTSAEIARASTQDSSSALMPAGADPLTFNPVG